MRRSSPPVLEGISTSSRLRIFAAFCVAVTIATGIGVRVFATDNAWVHKDEIEGLLDSNDAEAYDENECEGVAGIPAGLSPGWIRVGGAVDPHTPIIEVSGQLLDPHDYVSFLEADAIESQFKTNAFVNFTDNHVNHFARDLNAFVTLDPEYRHFLSTGSFEEGDSNELGNMEIEWERGGIPMYAFPAIGDRITVWGTHIFDCGHGDTWITDSAVDNMYRTEIHPPYGWVVYRQTADADGVPDNDKQHESPWQWYHGTDLQGVAATLPGTGLLFTPVHATVADAYFTSFGGNAVESVNGCDDDDPFMDCFDYDLRPELSGNEDIDSWEWSNPILDNDYTFVVPAPPKPAGAPSDVQMIYDFEDRCAEVPPDPTIPNKHDHQEALDEVEGLGPTQYSSDRPIGNATCNPTPAGQFPFTYEVDRAEEAPFQPWNTTGRPAVRFTIRAKTGHDGIDGNADDPTYPSNDYISFAYRVKVAWDYAPPAAERARNFRVDFDTLHVYNDGDFCDDFANTDFDDGEWIISLRVGDQTIHPVEGTAPDDNDSDDVTEPFWETDAIDDERCGGNEGQPRDYEMGSKGEPKLTRFISALAGAMIEVWDRTYDKDGDNNDDLAPVFRNFYPQPPPGGSGNHTIGTTDADIDVAHTIDFSITDVSEDVPATGPLSIGDPKYGPNGDTQNRVRVSGVTPISFTPPPGATGFEYRVWQPLVFLSEPGPWQYDFDASDGLTVDLPNTGSDVYLIEWATINGTGNKAVVSVRSRMEVELDNIPPALALPGSFSVYANTTAGADVAYSATATDNLPGPVTVVCIPPSGSVFPNGANAPLTTVVGCTATDAVLNQSAGGFDVTVISPHGYVKDYALLGIEWLDVGQDGNVVSGSAGVFDQSTGISGQPGIELRLGNDGAIMPAASVAAHSVKLGADVTAGDVFSVTPVIAGANSTFVSRPACGPGPASLNKCAYVPLWAALPAVVAAGAPGADQQINSNGSASLPPGNYGALVLKSKAVATLSAGSYSFARIELGPNARIEYISPATVISVAGRVEMKGDSSIRPLASGAPHLRLYVMGTDVVSPNGKALDASPTTTIAANVFVPNGTLSIGNNSILSGAFIGRRVSVGSNVGVTKDSVFVLP